MDFPGARLKPRPAFALQERWARAGSKEALIVAGGALVGAGAGAAFKGSVSTVIAVTSPGARGEALAGLFLAYAGLAVPVVGLGLATQLLCPRGTRCSASPPSWWPWSALGCWELIG